MRLSREVILLLCIYFIMSLGMHLVNALRSLYIQGLGATVMQVSTVISLTGVAGTLLRIPGGWLSDHYGRRRIIEVSVLLACFSSLLYTLSTSWEHVIPWGIMYAIAFSLYMPSRMAIIADYTPTEHRMRVYGIINMAWPLGSILGPTVSGLLESQYGWNTVFYVAALLHGIGIIPVILLPNPRPSETGRQSRPSHLDRALLTPLLPFFFFNLCIGLVIGSVESITPIYLVEVFDMSTVNVGLFLSIGFGVTTLLTQIPAGILADKIGKKRFLTLCVALLPLLFVTWTVINHVIVLLIIYMTISGLWSMTWPVFFSLLMGRSPPSQRGITTSLIQMGEMAGFTLGPYIGGFLWDTMGMTFPFYASAIFCMLCVITTSFIKEDKRE